MVFPRGRDRRQDGRGKKNFFLRRERDLPLAPRSFFFIYLSFSKASTFRLPAKFFAIPEGLRSTYSVTWFYEVSRSKFADVLIPLLPATPEVPNESEALKGTLLLRQPCLRRAEVFARSPSSLRRRRSKDCRTCSPRGCALNGFLIMPYGHN